MYYVQTPATAESTTQKLQGQNNHCLTVDTENPDTN